MILDEYDTNGPSSETLSYKLSPSSDNAQASRFTSHTGKVCDLRLQECCAAILQKANKL